MIKEDFLELLSTINRSGIEKLTNWLQGTDFFEAPASTKYHSSHRGGLAEHSLNVYKILQEKLQQYPYYNIIKISDDTLKIITLLHDICKTNYYTVEMRNKKNEQGQWIKEPYYAVNDTIPYRTRRKIRNDD